MNKHRVPCWFETALLVAVLFTTGGAVAQATEIGHPTFLSPHASPILTSGGHVFVVNTPADTVDVIDASSRDIVARINVGIDPVGMAVRPDGKEIWVTNHVSDSVSVIDSDPQSLTYLHVIATVQDFDPSTRATRFDEPVGVAFASNDKAYVALSSENQIAVINVATRQVDNKLNITAQDPRAIAVRGDRLYVIPFESNNQTQISGCVGPLVGDLCTFDAVEHVIDNNNVLSRFAVVDIVKHPQVPDRDLYVFDTTNDQLVEIVDAIGTLLYGLAVDSRGRVFVTQTDARNDVNGRAGTFGDGLGELENRAFLNQITLVDCSESSCAEPQFMDLEPAPPSNPAPGMALATPYAIEISGDDATLVVSAASSNKLFTVDAASGEVLGQTELGKVPRGIALESDGAGQPSHAWVLNAVANTVSLVDVSDTASPVVADTISLHDPTHPAVKRGRIAFNNAGASTTGTFSCESCHPDGGTDQVAWVLDTPICDRSGCTQIAPRITMPIRGLRDTAPYHWDGIPGDPYGGNNTANIRGFDLPNCSRKEPESCTLVLVDGGLATTMCDTLTCPVNEAGKDGALTAAERDDMAKFLLSVPYPPAQRRSYTNVLSSTAKSGFSLFHIEGDLQGDPEPNVCGNCHRMPFWVSTNTPGTGMDAPTWRGAYDRWLILPQGRLNIIDFDFYRNITVLGTPERELWQFSWVGRPRFDPVWNMVLEGSTGFSGSFARSVTLNQASADSSQTSGLMDALELSAAEGGIVLQGEGVFIDGETTTPVALQFDRRVAGGSYLERADGPGSFTRAELLALALEGKFIGTFTARLGANVDVDHPQPAIWTLGPIEEQSGKQFFPTLIGDNTTLVISGRHVGEGANLFIDGRRVSGTVTCHGGELPDCLNETIEVQLDSLPLPAGMHFLQVQNQDGLFSNDFITHSNDQGQDNCTEIPNPDQNDADGDGIGDRCDDDAFEFDIEQGISGTWYDPDHDGEGWFVELLNENTALVYWFTYTPPAVGGNQAQAWIGGIGEIKGSSIVVPSAGSWISSGPPFGPDFDPDQVELNPWGKFVLSFSSCNGGVMYYQSDDPDYGNGSQILVRLTEIETLECGEPVETTPQSEDEFTVSPALSGAWYDPSHEGEGWLLEILADGQALLAWFSYDPQGEQAWFLSTGVVAGNSITFDLSVPTGTDFGPTFDPNEVNMAAWGIATFTFDDCNSGSMTYDSPLEGYGSGSLGLTRLTNLSGLECE
jgi:YVTN family beta-propeller protein